MKSEEKVIESWMEMTRQIRYAELYKTLYLNPEEGKTKLTN
jgi:hypothetical protein